MDPSEYLSIYHAEIHRLCEQAVDEMKRVSTRMSTGAIDWTEGTKQLAKLYAKIDAWHEVGDLLWQVNTPPQSR